MYDILQVCRWLFNLVTNITIDDVIGGALGELPIAMHARSVYATIFGPRVPAKIVKVTLMHGNL